MEREKTPTERMFALIFEVLLEVLNELDNPELTERVRDRVAEMSLDTQRAITATEPVPFAGSEMIRLQNRETHRWVNVSDEEIRCYVCDAKVWHVAADYRCGEEVPRREIR